MNVSPTPAADADPHTIKDRIFWLCRDHIPARNRERFFEVLDDPCTGTANPADPREPNPHPQWVMDALDKIDALIDPYHPLPDEVRKAIGAIRLAAMKSLAKLDRERMRRRAGKSQL